LLPAFVKDPRLLRSGIPAPAVSGASMSDSTLLSMRGARPWAIRSQARLISPSFFHGYNYAGGPTLFVVVTCLTCFACGLLCLFFCIVCVSWCLVSFLLFFPFSFLSYSPCLVCVCVVWREPPPSRCFFHVSTENEKNPLFPIPVCPC